MARISRLALHLGLPLVVVATPLATASERPAPNLSLINAAQADREVLVRKESVASAAAAKLQQTIRAMGKDFAVAALDLRTGASFSYNTGAHFDTASIIKLEIAAELLRQHELTGVLLSGSEDSRMTAMIEHSDNDAATALWDELGGADGLASANRTWGLTQTTPGTGGDWGLTETTAQDQLTLLKQVFDGRILDAPSKAYLDGLLADVSDGQHWGISAAAKAGEVTLLKNGWLPLEVGNWEVNSIGEVGSDVLIVVLSDDNTTEAAGIAKVESIASLVVPGLAS